MEANMACKKCNFLSGEKVCPICGGETSKEWQGYVIIMDPDRSEIARNMGINHKGEYALRVR